MGTGRGGRANSLWGSVGARVKVRSLRLSVGAEDGDGMGRRWGWDGDEMCTRLCTGTDGYGNMHWY